MNNFFELKTNLKPAGDQSRAINKLVDSINEGNVHQTLLGVTGSGKTFTMANVIAKINKPTLIIAPNKILAAQLCGEFKEFFPNNFVEYFVSYYDYYQPEAYVPKSDTYIAKDSSINEEIDRLRHSATAALFEKKDVIIVSSVSCIYGLGSPGDYNFLLLSLRENQNISREEIIKKLINIQYARNDTSFNRNTFRIRGDIIEIIPANSIEKGIKVELFDDRIDKIYNFDILTGENMSRLKHISIFPASHYIVSDKKLNIAIKNIKIELDSSLINFKNEKKMIEFQRIKERTMHDIEMMSELGYCSGIENYSRHLTGKKNKEAPYTLLDYFPNDFLLMIDESHVTIPQIRGMYNGDYTRKRTLVDFGFRLPSALDNRPLEFKEFEKKINQVVYVSATPGDFELSHSTKIIEQIIRPTWLVDPEVEVRPTNHQIDDLQNEIKKRIKLKERILVTTLTKKMAENLSEYFRKYDLKVCYLHSEIKTLERIEIIRNLRLGIFDILIGINLLREGLDIPEVSLVAILDGDKEGFLRSERSLIQIIGRASRNINGKVIIYADTITKSIEKAISETERRRKLQKEYNIKNKIIPKGIFKEIRDLLEIKYYDKELDKIEFSFNPKNKKEKINLIKTLEKEMLRNTKILNFEKAAELRDLILDLKSSL